jgi:hypothetical protein
MTHQHGALIMMAEGNRSIWRKLIPQCQTVHHKFHTDYLRSEHGPLG